MSFVSVTQQFNTATSMGRLMLNVLLSFAQFEREIITERTRDKIAATRRKGKWSGGMPLLGYDVVDTKLVVERREAERVRQIFELVPRDAVAARPCRGTQPPRLDDQGLDDEEGRRAGAADRSRRTGCTTC